MTPDFAHSHPPLFACRMLNLWVLVSAICLAVFALTRWALRRWASKGSG